MGHWIYSGQKIWDYTIDGLSPTAFTDLDVSSIVGANRAVLYLSVEQSGGSPDRISVRPDGESYDTNNSAIVADHGVCHAYTRPDKTTSIMVVTGPNGIFEWKTGTTLNFDIRIEGYFIPTLIFAMIDTDFTLPTGSWDDVDASGYVGSKRALAIVRHRRISGAGDYGFSCRSNGDTEDYLGGSTYTLGAQHGVSANGTEVEVLCALTDDAGIYELRSTAGAQHHELYAYAAETNGFVDGGGAVLEDGVLALTTWTEVDAGIGKSGLAFLRAKFTHVDAANHALFVRRKGDTKDYARWQDGYLDAGGCSKIFGIDGVSGMLVVPLDDDGKLEYYQYASGATTSEWEIELLGYVTSPTYPTMSNIRPANTVTEEPTKLGFAIEDDVGIDLSTIDLQAVSPTGVVFPIIVAGVIQSDWDGFISGTDSNKHVIVQLEWNTSIMENRRLWRFDLEAENLVGFGVYVPLGEKAT